MPRLTFKANDRAALGFTEADSAGQTNIFAVEVSATALMIFILAPGKTPAERVYYLLLQPKTYIAGSSRDDGSNSSIFALGAFMLSATILAGVVTVLTDSTGMATQPALFLALQATISLLDS